MAVEVRMAGLRASYVAHRDAADRLAGDNSGYLLLFYAVECGLKSAWLKRQGLRGTSDLPAHLRSHNLRELAKALRLGAEDMVLFRDCTLHASRPEKVRHDELHQVWRYGARLESNDQKKAVAGLTRLVEWCRSELGA
ncbi:hypothetical protein [Goodfellowiella coeruleoviolacea]|uniref:hypothetical protein n=1 Tax=Goodfellowiella coeruleoviolacea TaxID=334858 RepID=UPI0020A321FD|nr:hypothetical protein [Goodfellowiella coeruleoviolacea]